MNHFSPSLLVPEYRGHDWIDARLPNFSEPWPLRKNKPISNFGDGIYEVLHRDMRQYAESKLWVWPRQAHYFFCDLHADADAFLRSLIASGGIEKNGPRDGDFALTGEGRDAIFVIGGDCLDKGPNNLRLLRLIKILMDKGAQVELLAGNHDLRTFVGIVYAGRTDDPLLAHLFVRMGKKSVRLLREIHDDYLAERRQSGCRPSAAVVRKRLFPGKDWYEDFPKAAAGFILDKRIKKEVQRIAEKVEQFESKCTEYRMTLNMAEAAVHQARKLFLEPGGEFHWFYKRMKLAYRAGSYLFIHAGVDDYTAEVIRRQGIEGLNRRFRRMLRKNLFHLYHGPLGNTFRTKYRDVDMPLTTKGVAEMHANGLYAIVHGHRSIDGGQRMVIRQGLLNFECDASVDANTRREKDLEGPGGAVTIFRSDGRVLGISTDYPHVKVFDPANVCNMMTLVQA